MVDEALGNQFIMIIIGGLVVLGGAVGLIYVRRRRKSLSEFEESILTSGDINTGEISTGSEDIAGDSGDTSFLSDFSQGGMGNISTDEVDPVAEADVYLAYGRDEQAEEILKDAIVKNPARHELKEKLLEIYAQRGDVGAFETLAEELYASLEGKGGELWDRVAAMGSTLNSGNPMFQGGAPSAAPATPAMDAGAGLEMTTPATDVAPVAEETRLIDLSQMQEEAMAPEIDMDTGSLDMLDGSSDETEVVPDSELDGLEFNLDISSGNTAEVMPESNEIKAPSLDVGVSEENSGAIDFEAGTTPEQVQEDEIAFDADEISIEPVADEDVTALDVSEMDTSLDISDLDAGGLSMGEEAAGDLGVAVSPEVEQVGANMGSADQWDEAATKLDLAKAYIDMGDAEGARSILEEVALEGNEDQQRQAADLASQVV